MTDLDLKPVVVFHRPNGTNAESEDYRFVCVDSLSSVSAPEGFTELGLAFTCSQTPGTLSDGTTLIPLYHKQMTYEGTGGVYDVLVTDDTWQSRLWTTVATYYVFPHDCAKYGATKLHAWNSQQDEKVHWYSTTNEMPGGRTWASDGPITNCTVCPINTVLVTGGDGTVPLGTSASRFVNGVRTWVPGGDTNVYPAVGNIVEFKRDAQSTFKFASIEISHLPSGSTWTFDWSNVGQTNSGPFVCDLLQDDRVVLRDNNASAANHGQYKYTIQAQTWDGHPISCDPKVINRSQTATVQSSHQSPGQGGTAGT